ncbi:pectinesterase family protein [Bacteroidales bacterium OttesenSCG-928-L03]|nr:pectinesterase family protein [Bacteroidales bacterium OttesenSCG-928-L03]
MKSRILLLSMLFVVFSIQAKETAVNSGTFAAAYTAAEDGDILLLATGKYGGSLAFPHGKTITLKAQAEASPVFSGNITGSADISGGGLIFDGVDINREENYLLSTNLGDMQILAFRNLTIQKIGRCLLRTDNVDKTIDKIEFDNCIIKDCGANGWNFLYPKHAVKEVVVRNSTLYNYTGGESFFFPNQTYPDNVLSFVFENNTVYKWAKSSDRALCKTEGKYSAASTYTFRNNIITVPGVAGQKPQVVQTNSGTVVGENNLVVDYGGYTGGTQTINDLTLAGLGLTGFGFPDPDNGDFSIISSSPLATAGTAGKCLGDPRWIKTVSAPASLTTVASPIEGGTVLPLSGIYNVGDQVSVTATHHYGYRFKEWQVGGVRVSEANPYTFPIERDTELKAVFEAQTTYTLTVHKEGEGAEWGRVSLSPEPINGIYEAGEIVTMSIIPNGVTSFLYWEDQSTTFSRQILMDGDKSFTARFDLIPFIAGWDFNNPSAVRGNRPGDFYFKTNNRGVLKFFNGDGSSTNWGGSTKSFGGVTYDCARRYTEYADMAAPRYFQAEFSAKGEDEYTTYKDIRIYSLVGADNVCVHKIQKLQYATRAAGPYTDLATVDLTDAYNKEWVELEATLPPLTEAEKENLFIRWIGDTSSELLGSAKAGDTEGFYLANVIIYAEIEEAEDPIAPALISSIPAPGSSTASATGSIILNFDKKVKAGSQEGKITFNGETLTPVFGSKTVSYPYKDLEYGKEYTLTIPSGVITNKDGVAYPGSSITFSVMERPQPIARNFDAVVALDGSGDYTSVQAAVNAAPAGRATPWLIFVKNGSYKELVHVPANKSFIHLIGQDREKTIIHEKINVQGNPENDKNTSYYANSLAAWEYSANNPQSVMYKKNDGTVVKIEGSDFYSENISYINDWGVEAHNGPQALAMMSYGDRIAFYNCAFHSYQDTWKTANTDTHRGYAKDCFIAGAVDYIYGTGNYYFETCTLYCVRDGSVIVAPSHKEAALWGYVFESCLIDGVSSSRTQFGRPWHNRPIAVFLNTVTKIGLDPLGWTTMGGCPRYFSEYNTTDVNGNAVDTKNRRKCYTGGDYPGQEFCIEPVLTAAQAATFTYSAVIQGSDEWNPRSKFEPVGKTRNLKRNKANQLAWDKTPYAISYIVYRGNEVIGFTKENNYLLSSNDPDASYYVRSINEYGSLGELSDAAVAGEWTSIEDARDTKLTYELVGSGLILYNVPVNSNIRVYTSDGRWVKSQHAYAETTRISTAGLRGVFLIKVEQDSLKVSL